jgi:hypothetical protein
MDINNPIPQEWTRYVTQTNLGLEVIPSVLFSVKAYTSGVTTLLPFFDTVSGARPDLSNMQQPNMLPNPESFLIENIRIFNWSEVKSNDSGAGDNSPITSQFNDWVQLTKRGLLNLKIGNKSYGPWPLWMLAANSFVKGAFASGSDLLADYGQLDGALYPLIPMLMIAPLQQFSCFLTWPGAATDAPIPGGPVTLSQDTVDDNDVTIPEQLPIEILFDGKLARSIQ